MASMPNVNVLLKIDGHITEREAVLRERAAWVACDGEFVGADFPDYAAALEDSKREAASRYPLPKVERPRVVRDVKNDNIEWTVLGGALKMRNRWNTRVPGEWIPWRHFRDDCDSAPSPERVAMWSDLFANPTELVDDDGSAGGGQ